MGRRESDQSTLATAPNGNWFWSRNSIDFWISNCDFGGEISRAWPPRWQSCEMCLDLSIFGVILVCLRLSDFPFWWEVGKNLLPYALKNAGRLKVKVREQLHPMEIVEKSRFSISNCDFGAEISLARSWSLWQSCSSRRDLSIFDVI